MLTATSQPTMRHWVALAFLGLPLFMMATDFTAIFLAMPAVGADLTPTTTQMLWMIHIGELVAAGTLITMGWLTGRIGPRMLLLFALAMYGSASALAAFATSAEVFLIARVLIGLSTAAASPAAFAMLRSLFTSARHYGVGFAVVMGAFTVGAALGPPITGFLLDHFWWGSVFLTNVPIAALALGAGLVIFPRTAERITGRIDIISVGVSIAAITLAVYSLQELADQGYSTSYVLALGASIILGYWFVRRQRRIDNPLLDVELFAMRVLRVLAAFYILVHIAFVAVDFVIIQYMQIVESVSSTSLGLILAVPAIGGFITTTLTPILVRKFMPATIMAAGIGTSIVGSVAVLVAITLPSPTVLVALGLTIISVAMSPPMVLGAQLMVTSVSKKQAGTVAAVQDVAASVGSTLGVMVMGSTAMIVFGARLDSAAPEAMSQAELDAASESPGGAVAVAESLDQATGQALLPVIDQAWSWAVIAVYGLSVVIGAVTLLVSWRGLRGIPMPSDDDVDSGHSTSEPPGVDQESAASRPVP